MTTTLSQELTAMAAASFDPRYQNIPMTDVVKSFSSLKTSTNVEFLLWLDCDQSMITHIQGMGRYGHYVLFTHNSTDGPGYFIIGDHSRNSCRTALAETPGGSHHPGGFQIIGNFAAVGVDMDHESRNPSWVCFYDLEPLKRDGNPKLLKSATISQPDWGAACAGITYAGDRYILAVYSVAGKAVHVYQSNAGQWLDSAGLKWEHLFKFTVSLHDKNIGYDSLNLVTDRNGEVYMIGMRGMEVDARIEDYADLIEIDVARKSHWHIKTVHFNVKRTTGMIGAHFRWGAGTSWEDMDTMEMFCAARSMTDFGTEIAKFKESQDTTELWRTSLPQTGHHPVTVLCDSGYTFAGSHGYIYSLNHDGQIIAKNELKGFEEHDVRMGFMVTDSGAALIVGTNGSVVSLDPKTLAVISSPSLPASGGAPVNIGVSGAFLGAGSHGYVYKIDFMSGRILHKNELKGTGRHEVRLAVTPDRCYAGTNGYLIALRTSDLAELWRGDLPGSGEHVTDVVANDTGVFAACNGRIYKYDLQGKLLKKNDLKGEGEHEVRLAVMANCVYAGMNGHLYCLDTETLKLNWKYSLPDSGLELVNVLAKDDKLFAGSNGYFYQLTPGTGRPTLLHKGDLKGMKEREVRLSTYGRRVIVGTNGYALGYAVDSL